jgi:hypothetical protein
MSLVVAFSMGAVLFSSTFLSVKTILTLMVAGVDVGAAVFVLVEVGVRDIVAVGDAVIVEVNVRDGVRDIVHVGEGVVEAVIVLDGVLDIVLVGDGVNVSVREGV